MNRIKGKAVAAFTAMTMAVAPLTEAAALSTVKPNSTDYLTREQENTLLQNALVEGRSGPAYGTSEPHVATSLGQWKPDIDYMAIPALLSGHYPKEVRDYYDEILSADPVKRRQSGDALLAVAARIFPRFYGGDRTLYDGDPAKLTKHMDKEEREDRYSELVSLQFALDRMGYYPELKDNSDGMWGPATKEAVRDFQKDFKDKYKLNVTGYPDGRTLSALAVESTKVALGIAALSRAKAKRAFIDPRGFLQLLNHESSFTPCAISSTGAFGLGQFIYPTFKVEYEKEYGRDFKGGREAARKTCRNIDMSLTLAANHIRHLMTRLDLTRTVDAYVGYQQGAPRARKIQEAVKDGKGDKLAPYVLGYRAARVNLLSRVKIKDLFTHLVYSVDGPYDRFKSALFLQAIEYMEKINKPEPSVPAPREKNPDLIAIKNRVYI